MSQDIYAWMRANLPVDAMILEIGAHHAEDSERFLQMLRHCRIIAWEADPRNIPVIGRKVHPRGPLFSDRFRCVPMAVGAHDGDTTFYLSGGVPAGATGEDRRRDWTYSSSIRKPQDHLTVHPSVKFVGETKVRMVTLDSWFEAVSRLPGSQAPFGPGRPEQGRIDFIWADVQGAEGDMIRGGPKTLARTRWLFTEFDDRPLYEGQINKAAILELLGPSWSEVGIFENNVLLRNNAA